MYACLCVCVRVYDFQRPGLEEDTSMAQLSMCIYQNMAWPGHRRPLDMLSVLLWVSLALLDQSGKTD